jgi:hypothetical protein
LFGGAEYIFALNESKMKRTQRCFDLISLEQERPLRLEIKRSRTDSEQTDLSIDSDLSDMSEKFETSTSLTPTSLPTSDPLQLHTIRCEFTFQPEDFSMGSSSKAKAGLGNVLRKSGLAKH